ncbi:MAG: PA14 domain-containing protein, partial [Candidatus Nanohalobium sp.]
FTPQCSSSCSSATLSFNTTGNLTFQTSKGNWQSGDLRNLETSNENLTLYNQGVLGKLNYKWYKTEGYYNSNGHPSTKEELDEFFDASNSNVSFGGEGYFSRRVHWHDDQWDSKPDYLPTDYYSWKATGYLYAPKSGTYTIGLDSDDAADILIDGNVVASWYGGHGTAGDYSHNGEVYLEKGEHRIKIRVEEGFGNDGISVAWKKPGESSFETIPAKRFANASVEYRESGSFESEEIKLDNPVYWTNFSKKAKIPVNTSLDTEFAVKEPGGWQYYEKISDVPKTKILKVNVSFSTEENYTTPELDSYMLEYKTPANQDFYWITETKSNFEKGNATYLTVDPAGKIRLKKNATGPKKNLHYTWYDTEGLNSRNEYANDEEEMDKLFNTSVEGVSLGGEGRHSGRVHWHNGNTWDSKPTYLPASNFAWKATGYLFAPKPGTYTVGIDSDDASDLFIDGTKVASFYGGHGTDGDYSHNGEIYLEKGFHTIKVRMQEHTGGDGVSIAWIKPNKNNFEVIKDVRLYPRVYQDSGNYTSRIFQTLNQVEWKSAEVKASTPPDTGYDIDYGSNVSGSWIYNESITAVPEAKYFRYRIHMETADNKKTPSVDRVNLTYTNSKTFFKEMKTVTDVDSGVLNNLTYDFSSYSLPSTFKWNIRVKQSNGDTNTSETRQVTVKPKTYPSPEIKWYKPEEGASNRTPINFTFKPTCYSKYGCYEVSLYFNSTGKYRNWVNRNKSDWSEGLHQETQAVNSDLMLNASVGAQNKLRYYWYSTDGLNSGNGYANSEEEMDDFFNRKIDGVKFEGTGEHSGRVHWHSGSTWEQKPDYLSGDHYSWKAVGYLYAPTTGTYTIGVDSDDAADIHIDGKLVASWYGPHGIDGDYSHSGEITLKEGYHTVKIRVQEDTGGDGVSIAWIRPNKNNFRVIKKNRFFLRDFASSGTYTSPVLSSNKKFDPVKASIGKEVPLNTNLNILFEENSSGTWKSYESISDVPQTRYLRYKAEMSTKAERTPRIDKINITYYDEEVMKKREAKEEVYNKTKSNISYRFLEYSLPQYFKAFLAIKQSNGDVTRSATRTFKVKFSGIKARISWNDRASNEIGYKIYTNASGSWNKVGEVERNTESFQD